MKWARDNYYVTRAGEKVRLICTDAGEAWPLVFIGDGVGVVRHPPSGFRASSEFDIIGPWVEPVKPLEVWVNFYKDHSPSAYASEGMAKCHALSDALRIAVHMREVLP